MNPPDEQVVLTLTTYDSKLQRLESSNAVVRAFSH